MNFNGKKYGSNREKARTTETMASLLRDLTDMGIAVNPDVQSETVQQTKTKVVSIFESHWEHEARG